MALKSERGGIGRSRIAASQASCGSGDGRIVNAGEGATRLSAIQCLLDRSRVDAGRIEPLPQPHRIAVLVELNGIRAAAFTEMKAQRLDRVLQDAPLRRVLRHLETQTSCTRPQRLLLNRVQIRQELLEFKEGRRQFPFARDRCSTRMARGAASVRPSSRLTSIRVNAAVGTGSSNQPIARRQAQWHRRSRPRTRVAA